MVYSQKYPAQTGDRHTWCDPIFSDTFQNNTAQWNTNPPAGARITLANDGKLILESENHTIFTESLPGSKPLAICALMSMRFNWRRST